MKAKLIRKIPAREGLPYYFDNYEFECIECGEHYTRKNYSNRTLPYCYKCQKRHDKEKEEERKAKRIRSIENAILDKLNGYVLEEHNKFYKMIESDEWTQGEHYAYHQVLQMIADMRGAE